MNIDTEALIGQRLNDNWVIDRTHPTYSGATGRRHSLCFIAKTSEGKEAFVKLLDPSVDSKVAGLYFIGEVVDVTGWLGGYNFQWAWSSGWCAGQVV